MNLPARAADLRGNEFQHARAWRYAVDSLTDPDILSVSVEDPEGGAFDDIVVRRASSPNLYEQAKSSNYGSTIIDQEWLFAKKTTGGKSPLQHFFSTWTSVQARNEDALFNLVSNRGYDSTHRILGHARDQWDSRIVVSRLDGGPASANRAVLEEWAEHLGATVAEVLLFLADLRLVTTSDMTETLRELGHSQRNAGLRGDEEAVTLGIAIVRRWVMVGRRPVTRDEIAADVLAANIVDSTSGVRLVVHGIDRYQGAKSVAELDFTGLYVGDTAQERREFRDPGAWAERVAPELKAIGARVESYGVHSIRIDGWMRLPMWFAMGRAFPRVRNWRLSTTQNGIEWVLTPADEVAPSVVTDDRGFVGTDLVVVVQLSNEAEPAVRRWIADGTASVGQLLVLQPELGPSQTAVVDAAWLMGWIDGARRAVLARTVGVPRVHLFLTGPAAAALALGYQWNMMPETTVYEWLPSSQRYVPIFTTS
ncbi:SAVED domain-containing protein [Cryobacterium breve]|uniref:SAVED domain-containing protein n=1 Tax=Cryobacterium breve TaxID=1259258 RepID=A0ABY7NEA9_9MICO|nr:SAVED domain-containing protein [Cryobacterium breve]WBM79131.1 SAVED domain-containing protein [Cryobacterium breve]